MSRLLWIGLSLVLVGCVAQPGDSNESSPVEPYKERLAKLSLDNPNAYRNSYFQ